MSERRYSLQVAVALVIANMVGTGVFTSVGYQVDPVPSPFAILMLWVAGGAVSLCGALCYAELATRLRDSGGEYVYLSRIFHPAIGFLSGWTSLLVGFAGAISAVALAIGAYTAELTGWPEVLIAATAILLVTGIHLFGVRAGGVAQALLTGFKLTLIVFFCLAPFVFGDGITFSLAPKAGDFGHILSSGWAVSLVYVVYAYSGWNAASYITGNLENSERNIPRSLLVGTLAVMVMYLALNAVFLGVAGMDELRGQNDVGNVVAIKLFGMERGRFFSGVFGVALMSTLSAMIIAGPRVGEAIGRDYPVLKWLSRVNRYGMPWPAIVLQAVWSLMLVFISSFQQIIGYISVSLSWFTMLAVLGLVRLRMREQKVAEGVFRMPLYPLPAVFFLAVTGAMIFYVSWSDPVVLVYSLITQIVGFAAYSGSKSRLPRA